MYDECARAVQLLNRHGCDAVTRVHHCPFHILQRCPVGTGGPLGQRLPVSFESSRFHRNRHQLIDATHPFLAVLPSRRYCPCQQKVFIMRSLLQFGVFSLYHSCQQTFGHSPNIVRGGIHDEGLEPQGAWDGLAGTTDPSQLVQSLGHLSVFERSLICNFRAS